MDLDEVCTLSIVSCPVCGGVEAAPISPGYVQCESVRIDRLHLPPNAGPVSGGPPFIEREAVCGHRYHLPQGREGAGSCECGTFAIGLCSSCGRDVCGDHSDLRAGRRECVTCQRAAADLEQEHARAARDRLEARCRAGDLGALREYEQVLISQMEDVYRYLAPSLPDDLAAAAFPAIRQEANREAELLTVHIAVSR